MENQERNIKKGTHIEFILFIVFFVLLIAFAIFVFSKATLGDDKLYSTFQGKKIEYIQSEENVKVYKDSVNNLYFEPVMLQVSPDIFQLENNSVLLNVNGLTKEELEYIINFRNLKISERKIK